jgi:hypothetical protein
MEEIKTEKTSFGSLIKSYEMKDQRMNGDTRRAYL